VRLLDIIQAHPGGLYLVFEYVAHDLKTYMDQFQQSDDITERVGLPLPTVRSFLRQIIAGVGCCHTYRILHRDLKPHNVRHLILKGHVPNVVFSCTTHTVHTSLVFQSQNLRNGITYANLCMINPSYSAIDHGGWKAR